MLAEMSVYGGRTAMAVCGYMSAYGLERSQAAATVFAIIRETCLGC